MQALCGSCRSFPGGLIFRSLAGPFQATELIQRCPDVEEIPPVKSYSFVFFVLFVALLLIAQPSMGQIDSSTATLRGTVVDPNGAVIAGAVVTATNNSTGLARV